MLVLLNHLEQWNNGTTHEIYLITPRKYGRLNGYIILVWPLLILGRLEYY